MTRLLLDGYRPIKNEWPVHELDTSTGRIETQWFESQLEARKAGALCGMGDFRKLGSWGSRHEGFVALYAQQGALHLWLDGVDVNLGSHAVEVKRGVDFLLRKRFRVHVDGQVVFESRYSYLDHEDFPDEDIFWGMARSVADSNARRRTLLIWEDKANGIDQSTDSYFKALDERLRRTVP